MFTGFATENPTNVRVWDFCRGSLGTPLPVITLTDDCEEYQVVLTGGPAVTNAVGARLYLPEARIEGKKITIINSKFNNLNNQRVDIFSSDVGATAVNSSGTTSPIFSLGAGASISLIYSKYLNFRATGGRFTTGWISLESSSPNANSAYTANFGGNGNMASGFTSTAVGGSFSFASGTLSSVIGSSSSTASGLLSCVIAGDGSTASNSNSMVIGTSAATASGVRSLVLGGSLGDTRSITGSVVTPANSFAANMLGRAQSAKLVLSTITTTAASTTLTSNNSTPAATNQVAFNNTGAVYYFRGSVAATDGTSAKGWNIEGVIKRNSGGTTSMVGTPTVTSPYGDAGAAAWAVSVVADTTFNCIAVNVTGAAGVSIRWICEINTTEGVV